ncbi:hypothetical protein [Luteimonas sp. TWI1437]|uniref:hypothetical protein n=1 Tax=unclassified Luteimonas TaxID=2629088 RepID=UPI003208AAFF
MDPQFAYTEAPSGVDPARALIYLWEVLDPAGQVVGRYVGKAKNGAQRLRMDYRKNVNNVLAGRPYRLNKPTAFRAIHRTMAEAIQAGHTLRLTLLCNIPVGESIDAVDQMW